MKQKRIRNRSAERFLQQLASYPSLEEEDSNLTIRCKFNFSYFDKTQSAGQDFADWPEKQILTLLDTLKEYCKNSLTQWITMSKYVNYGVFPLNSDFTHPKHVPHQAQWGRFRLDNKTRLVGFTVPGELHRTPHKITKELFDKNTFYVVFLDKDHKFYKTERK